jgi:hypothetical protein
MARLPRSGGPLADCNQVLNWREKFETCPGWGGKKLSRTVSARCLYAQVDNAQVDNAQAWAEVEYTTPSAIVRSPMFATKG